MVDQDPHSNVKFAPVDQQWVLDILLDNELSAFDLFYWRLGLFRLNHILAKAVLFYQLFAFFD
jgi:hypothetical protein